MNPGSKGGIVMTELSHLFSPIKIGNCKIRNRILQSGHGTMFSEEINGMILPTERHARYYGRRAKGGIGLIIMEAVAVSPHSTVVKGLCHGFRDEIIPRFKMISDAVHAHGAKIFCQAWHGGNKSHSFRHTLSAPS
jgi:2,4-dienoyl-CoA reductase-like NADH-dependent reductase (Old Yellow Enzyme family)